MKKENGPERTLQFDIEVREDDKLIAFCGTCEKVIFKGNDLKPANKRVLKRTLSSHLDAFHAIHNIDIIFIGREKESFVDAEIYLSTGAYLTSYDGMMKRNYLKHPTI